MTSACLVVEFSGETSIRMINNTILAKCSLKYPQNVDFLWVPYARRPHTFEIRNKTNIIQLARFVFVTCM